MTRAAPPRARIDGFREDTRARRMRVADEAERRFERKVAWGARCGDIEAVFTHLSAPVMTRLRMGERRVLDTARIRTAPDEAWGVTDIAGRQPICTSPRMIAVIVSGPRRQ